MVIVQCLRGTKIGQVKIELMNEEYYYFYTDKQSKNVDFDDKGDILFIQYKLKKTDEVDKEENERELEFCGMAFGTYEKKDIKVSNNKLLEVKVKKINFNQENTDQDEVKKSIEDSDIYKHIIGDILKIKDKCFFKDINDCIMNVVESTKNETEELNNYTNDYSTDTEFEKVQELYEEYLKCMEKFENTEYKDIFDSYEKLEKKLNSLAQKSIYAKRVINKGDRRKNRTEYQRDWERIIHSKSFRRLEDKAQIYTLSKGDHFRTRLTHSLEVTQIARGLARELDLNEDLVEAIALGHDLGHTPFGHEGERTLNEILKNEGVKGGFKHNFQGVKVVNYLEEKYGDFEGMDLTYQVMEGILKHTKISDCEHCNKYNKETKNCNFSVKKALKCEDNIYQIRKFLCKGDIKQLHIEYDFATTLEGQVVAVADEIAQRAHDLDDGIASGIINETEFLQILKENNLFNDLYNMINKSIKFIDENKRDYIDTSDIKRARIISDVITYFIKEIVKNATQKMKDYITELSSKNSAEKAKDVIVIKKKLIDFDGNIEKVREKLEEITSNKIINSEEVNCFDGKGKYIINKLYKAYITNPKQMSETTRKRIKKEISRYTNDKFDLKNLYIKDDENIKLKSLEIDDISLKLRLIKHRVFIRSIIDLISGMTDEFANKQFEKLYSPRTY